MRAKGVSTKKTGGGGDPLQNPEVMTCLGKREEGVTWESSYGTGGGLLPETYCSGGGGALQGSITVSEKKNFQYVR